MKKKIYNFILSLPWPICKLFIDLSDFCKDPSLCLINRKQIKQFFKENKDIAELDDKKMTAKDIKMWEKAFLYYAISSPRAARKIADNFCKCSLKTLKEDTMVSVDSPIYLCVVKDDLERIKMSYEHHSKIGVKHFVYIDNGSTDGTLEWLMQQENVSVYQTLDSFIMWAKVAWISKVITHIGFDRWYLVLDSDELFVYPGCEEKPIQEYVSCLERKGITRDLSFMLDMYATGKLFEAGDEGNTIYEKYRYFDGDSYKRENCLHYQKIMGGPRQRLFAKAGSMEMLQNKYPLVYYKRGEVYRYHYVSPYKQNFGTECTSALLHYKFLDGDYEKYVKIANDGNYANGSRLYKDIVKEIEENESLSFFDKDSIRYNSSKDLLRHELISDWKER